MSHPLKNNDSASLNSLDDVLFGIFGASLPPSRRIDHAVRFLGTWSGSDKLLMTVQYAAKLLAPLMLRRAEIQFNAGRRAKPLSLTTEGLYKFAGQLSIARRASGFWGILAIIQALSALERNRPASRLKLNLQRLQGISMLIFYPLEYISFFTSPFAPLLPPSVVSPGTGMKAGLWSVRSWGVYTALQVLLLRNEWVELDTKQMRLEGSLEGGKQDELAVVKKRKEHIKYQLVANIARLPVILHWSLIGGIYKSELWTNGLSFISAIAALLGGWESARLPPPKR